MSSRTVVNGAFGEAASSMYPVLMSATGCRSRSMS
jgi:hypothetical protein